VIWENRWKKGMLSRRGRGTGRVIMWEGEKGSKNN
jgi:hypothetical protein